MTNTYKSAKQELDILAATTPDATVSPFAEEILALCEKFGKICGARRKIYKVRRGERLIRTLH